MLQQLNGLLQQRGRQLRWLQQDLQQWVGPPGLQQPVEEAAQGVAATKEEQLTGLQQYGRQLRGQLRELQQLGGSPGGCSSNGRGSWEGCSSNGGGSWEAAEEVATSGGQMGGQQQQQGGCSGGYINNGLGSSSSWSGTCDNE